ncbi:hypothetical protein XENOCAPTIV_017012, partial [Xenoophorus captivus]
VKHRNNDVLEQELTVQPRVRSATGPLRLQACRVPVWSVKSTNKSKPVAAERGCSLPGQSWLVQTCMSSSTRNLHLALREENLIRAVTGVH